MKLTPHINEGDMDQLRTEQVQKKKNNFPTSSYPNGENAQIAHRAKYDESIV